MSGPCPLSGPAPVQPDKDDGRGVVEFFALGKKWNLFVADQVALLQSTN